MSDARVLIVDDQALNRMALRFLLESMDVICDEAADGRQALARIRDAHAAGQPHDCVLMDIEMPVMDGRDAICAIRGLSPPFQV